MKKYHHFLLLVFAGFIGTSLWFSFDYSSSYNLVNSYITSSHHHKPTSTSGEAIPSNPKSAFPDDFRYKNISDLSDFGKCLVTKWNSSYIDSFPQVRVESAEAFAYVDWSKSGDALNTIHANCTSNFYIKLPSTSQWTLVTGNSSQFHGEYIIARCNDTGQAIDNLFIQPPQELNYDLPHLFRRQIDSHITKSSDSSINDVIVILLDAVSRYHFHDEFPRTSSFLKRLHGDSSGFFESFEFKNYNSLGGHSPTNKVPMFGGSYFNDTMPAVEWLWDLAKTHDYITMHADPQCGGRSNKTDYKDYFNHTLIGYYGSSRDRFIADYIFPSAVFCLPKDEKIKKSCKIMEGPDKYISWYGWLPFCLAHRPSWEYQFEYITEFLNRTKKSGKKRFVMFNIYETHQPSLRRTSMDIAMQNMLETMFGVHSKKNDSTNTTFNTGSGLLSKSSAVFLLSDHGIHYDREYETFQGRIYHKRPFNHLILSNGSFENFPSSDPHITRKIIQDNTQRLTSHFDLFSTLKQFITGNYSSPPSNFSSPLPTSQNSSKTRINDASIYGRSFLFPIPSNRTCNTSGIPAEFCPCNIHPCTPEEIQSQISNSFDYINRKLVYHRVDSICPLINSTDAVIEYCDSQKYIDRVGVNMEVKLKSKPYVRLQLFRSTKGVISRVLYEDSKVRETCFSRLEQAGVDSKKWQYPCLCM